MKHLEIEMKTLLTEEEYHQLQANFSEILPITQKNYYLDMPDFYLRQNKIAMRIRTFEDSAELTIKIPQTIGNMEYNQAFLGRHFPLLTPVRSQQYRSNGFDQVP